MKKYLSIILVFMVTTAFSQKLKPTSTNDFIMECMKTNGEGAHKQIVIWLPYNFWEIIGEQMKASPGFVENLVSQMKDYMMFCVVDYTNNGQELNFKSDAEIRKSIQFRDSANTIMKPLEESEISADVKRLLFNMRPTMAQMLGQFGEGMQLYLFKAKQIKGKPSINVLEKNNFTLSWNTTNLTWKLPLSSVLPSKYCPVDNEIMKGNWLFCPTHGVKLDK